MTLLTLLILNLIINEKKKEISVATKQLLTLLFSSFFLSSLIIEKNTFEVRIYVTLILNLLSYFSTFTCYIDYNIRTCIVISNAHTMLSPEPQLLKGNISPIFKIKELWTIVFQPLARAKVFWRTFFILSVLFFK